MRIVQILVITLVISVTALSQSAYTPEKGSLERKAILDALRMPVERDLKQPIVFVPDNFKVQGTWAFISGTPQSPGGGAPNYGGTKFAQAENEGAFDNNFFALLRKTGGKWKVTTYAIGCTDVCFADWWQRYRAPKAIFPYTE
jgi:hypothetical protein